MDPKFRSSFIPKKTLDSSSSGEVDKYRSFNLISFVSIVVFLIAITATGTLYGYQYIIEGRIDEKGRMLEQLRDNINPEYILNLKDVDSRLNTARALLSDHTKVSSVFNYLENSTLRNVEFNKFLYSIDPDGRVNLSLDGKARNYNSLVLQINVFTNSEIFSEFNVSSISLDDFGNILFSIDAIVNKGSLLYDKVIEEGSN